MKKQIWKFKLEPGEFSIHMPQDAVVIAVQAQGDEPCIWALVNPNAKQQIRDFVTVPTGHPFDVEGLEYLGTFQLQRGALVFHTFEDVGP